MRRLTPIDERFWAKVEKHPSGCWNWTGGCTTAGYSTIGLGRRTDGKIYAHRFAYEALIGPIPPGYTLDHLCRNRRCVNPAHLEPVPKGINILRGEALSSFHARQTHCIHGHPFDLFNTRYYRGRRHCLTCRREWDKRRRRKYGAP